MRSGSTQLLPCLSSSIVRTKDLSRAQLLRFSRSTRRDFVNVHGSEIHCCSIRRIVKLAVTTDRWKGISGHSLKEPPSVRLSRDFGLWLGHWVIRQWVPLGPLHWTPDFEISASTPWPSRTPNDSLRHINSGAKATTRFDRKIS